MVDNRECLNLFKESEIPASQSNFVLNISRTKYYNFILFLLYFYCIRNGRNPENPNRLGFQELEYYISL